MRTYAWMHVGPVSFTLTVAVSTLPYPSADDPVPDTCSVVSDTRLGLCNCARFTLCGCRSLSLVGTRKGRALAARVRTTGGFTGTCQQSEPADLRDRPGSVTQKEEAAGTPSLMSRIDSTAETCVLHAFAQTHAQCRAGRGGQVGHRTRTSEFGRSLLVSVHSLLVRWLSRRAARTHARTDSVARCREMLRGFYLFSFQTHLTNSSPFLSSVRDLFVAMHVDARDYFFEFSWHLTI